MINNDAMSMWGQGQRRMGTGTAAISRNFGERKNFGWVEFFYGLSISIKKYKI